MDLTSNSVVRWKYIVYINSLITCTCVWLIILYNFYFMTQKMTGNKWGYMSLLSSILVDIGIDQQLIPPAASIVTRATYTNSICYGNVVLLFFFFLLVCENFSYIELFNNCNRRKDILQHDWSNDWQIVLHKYGA